MILRPSRSPAETNSSGELPVQNAWTPFLDSQANVSAPYGIVFQSRHSILAGDLARCLEERIFGPLPPDVIAAIARHDFGWDESDERQLKALPDAVPRPFPALDTEETLPSWSKSIALAAAVSPLVEVLVSRHFCLLGAGEPSRTGFVRAETARREAIERALPFPQADLDRWTGALGFCDLLSLYLCAGCTTPAEFPLAHPASPNAGMAPKTVLTWRSGSPVLSPPALKPATEVALSLRLYTRDGASQASESLAWSFGKHGFFQQQGT